MHRLVPLALAGCLFAAACSESNSTVSPSGPSAVLDALAGTWAAGSSPTALPTGCTSLDYTIAKSSDGSSGTITFSGVCAGVQGTGTGKGTVSGSTLNWSADGTATRDGLTCPFSVTQGTAALEGSGVRVTYTGSVCGLPVSGSELLQRK